MLFDTTVRKELARGFGATLVVILTIVLTMFLIRTVGQAASGAVSPQDVVLLLGYVALGHLPTMLALSLFIAAVLSLGRMYRDSEMAIWFASGVGLRRFVRPVLRTSWPVLLVIGLLLIYAWPWGNRSSQELRSRYQQRSDLARVTPGVFQKSSDGQRVFFVERDSADGVNARNVFVLSNVDKGESVISAHRGRQEFQGGERHLVLEEGQNNVVDYRNGERTQASFETYRVRVDDRAVAAAASPPPRVMRTLDLMRMPGAVHRAELTWRFGMLLAAANLLLLGIGLAATNPRRASNWNLLFALLTFFAYYNMVNLSQAWVANGRMSMAAALAAVHGTGLAMALALLWWREHATVWRPWGAARRPAIPAQAARNAA
jgi:lipopolysaccharide export system permease protein